MKSTWHAAVWTHSPQWTPRIGLHPSEARHGRERGSARVQMQKLSAGKFHGGPSRKCLQHSGFTPPSAGETRAYLSNCLPLCLPAAPVLPIAKNEKFGTFSFYEQFLASGAEIT